MKTKLNSALLTMSMALAGVSTASAEVVWTSDNAGQQDSRSTEFRYEFESTEGQSLSFNWAVSSETGCDYLHVLIDDQEVLVESGERSSVFSREVAPGNHVMVAYYQKDGSEDVGSDCATISDLTLTNIITEWYIADDENWTAKYICGVDICDFDESHDPAVQQKDGAVVKWFEPDYDDSEWGNLTGPVSRDELGNWEGGGNGAYWIRKKFNIVDFYEAATYTMRCNQDDAARYYINGTLVAEMGCNGFYDNTTINIDPSLLHEGENTLAVHVVDNGGGNSFIDFSLRSNFVFTSIADGVAAAEKYKASIPQYPLIQAEIDAAIAKANSDVESGVKEGVAISALFATVDLCKKAAARHDRLSQLMAEAESLLVDDAEAADVAAALADAKTVNNDGIEIAETEDAIKALAIAIGIWRTNDIDLDGINFNREFVAEDGIRYYINMENHVARLARFEGMITPPHVDIPAVVFFNDEVYTVVSIGEEWARDLAIHTVSIPKTVKRIEENAFRYMRDLESLTIPEGVTYIGRWAFLDCHKLTELNILSQNIQFWGTESFIGTPDMKIHLNSIVPPAVEYNNLSGGRKMVYIPADSFHAYRLSDAWSNCLLIGGDGVAVKAVLPKAGDLGDIVLSAGDDIYLQEVNRLTIEGDMNETDWNTFRSMSNLIEVDFSKVRTPLPDAILRDRWALERVVLPENMEHVPYELLCRCYNLEEINIPETVKSIGEGAFRECSKITSIVIPDAVENIRYDAFTGCYNLTDVKLPANLKEIEGWAFNGCSLTELELPSGVKNVRHDAFRGNKLTSLKLNEGLENIEEHAFAENYQLTEVLLPSTLRYCTNDPFWRCSNLKKITTQSVIPSETNSYCPISGVNMSDVTLLVPEISVNLYKLAPGWSEFYSIKSSNMMPENIDVYRDYTMNLDTTAFSISESYKPNVFIHNNSALTISSKSMLSAGQFRMEYGAGMNAFWADHDYWNWSTPRDFGAQSLIVNGDMRADDVELTLNCQRDRWNFVTFPFNIKVGNIMPLESETRWVIREYSGENRANEDWDNTWVNLTPDVLLQAGKGYAIHCYNPDMENVQFRLVPENDTQRQYLFDSKDKTTALDEYLPLYDFEQNRSWNLVGNPYPSFYDISYMDFTAPITIWNTHYQQYRALSPVDDEYVLGPGESFFVQKPVDKDNIIFSNEGRQTRSQKREHVARVKNNAAEQASRQIINIVLSSDNGSDQTRVVLNDKASTAYELDKDATKFAAMNAEQPQVYTVCGNVNYAINERPMQSGIVNLAVHCGADGMYAITLQEDINVSVMIEDTEMGTLTPLTADGGYTFSAKAGDYTDRFVLHFANTADGIIDHIADDATETPAYNLSGHRVNEANYRGIIIKNGQKNLK